jgi:hypothetical protein
MQNEILRLIQEHREIEAALDAVSRALVAGHVNDEALRRATELCRRHYSAEDEVLARIHPGAAAKIRAQHEEAMEIAARVDESLASPDLMFLARRFVAIAQHNIIEEERDVFPLARAE